MIIRSFFHHKNSQISFIRLFLGIVFIFLTIQIHAQSSSSNSGCRVKPENFQPLIQRFNPFFANHKWDDKTYMEVARLGEHRLLMISQDGCKRYHTTFKLIIDQPLVKKDYTFWVDEVKGMMHKIFFEQESSYQEYGKSFEELFEEKFSIYGFNKAFNFPIGTRNFICNINYHPEKEGRIYIEVVEYIFSEKVTKKKPKGIPREKDDGWKSGG